MSLLKTYEEYKHEHIVNIILLANFGRWLSGKFEQKIKTNKIESTLGNVDRWSQHFGGTILKICKEVQLEFGTVHKIAMNA